LLFTAFAYVLQAFWSAEAASIGIRSIAQYGAIFLHTNALSGMRKQAENRNRRSCFPADRTSQLEKRN